MQKRRRKDGKVTKRQKPSPLYEHYLNQYKDMMLLMVESPKLVQYESKLSLNKTRNLIKLEHDFG
jgi:hypothetical protein